MGVDRRLGRVRAGLACSIALFGLAACTSSRPGPAVCPETGIIHGLDRAAAAGDPNDAARVSLQNIDGLCTYDDGVLRLEMAVDIVTDAAPGTTIPYFVVIADPAGNLLDKTVFEAVVPDDATSRPLRLRESLVQEISGVADGTAVNYAVYFGLDLPPDTALEQRRTY